MKMKNQVVNKVIKQVIILLKTKVQIIVQKTIHTILTAMFKVKQITMKVKIQEMFMIGVKKIQTENYSLLVLI